MMKGGPSPSFEMSVEVEERTCHLRLVRDQLKVSIAFRSHQAHSNFPFAFQ